MPQAQSNSPTDTPACLSASWQYICKESAIFCTRTNSRCKYIYTHPCVPSWDVQKSPDKSLCTVTLPPSQPQHPVLNNIFKILLPLGSNVYNVHFSGIKTMPKVSWPTSTSRWVLYQQVLALETCSLSNIQLQGKPALN